jgi:iron(III) transport system ATP-binding protein
MLAFESVSHAYDVDDVVRDVSFTAAAGEVTCLVGPSGCGKTTLLRLAAGLLPLQSGRIRLGSTVLSEPGRTVPPESRPVGLVFQEGALFPHMTVAENIGFGVAPKARRARVAELLELVGLAALADRYPHTLSGGQRQRVALARALAPAPAALLFDEPYANLDQELRRALRIEARRSVRDSGSVGLFVTHDPEDIVALADSVVALHGGQVVQGGTPRELYDRPHHHSVARLFGQAQDVVAQVVDGALQTAFGRWPLAALTVAPPDTAPLLLIVRPDGLELAPDPDGLPVDELRVAGADDLLAVVAADGSRLFVRVRRPHGLGVGARVRVEPRSGAAFPTALANAQRAT